MSKQLPEQIAFAAIFECWWIAFMCPGTSSDQILRRIYAEAEQCVNRMGPAGAEYTSNLARMREAMDRYPYIGEDYPDPPSDH